MAIISDFPVRGAVKSSLIEKTLLAAGWSNNKQIIAVEGINENSNITVGLADNVTAEQYDAAAAAKLFNIQAAANQIIVNANGEIPVIDIPISIIVWGMNVITENAGAGSLEDLGVEATAEELNYSKGLTSNVQEQLDTKAPIYDYSTTDLTAGTSELETGKLYFVYE